jgi:hypothetical protein
MQPFGVPQRKQDQAAQAQIVFRRVQQGLAQLTEWRYLIAAERHARPEHRRFARERTPFGWRQPSGPGERPHDIMQVGVQLHELR